MWKMQVLEGCFIFHGLKPTVTNIKPFQGFGILGPKDLNVGDLHGLKPTVTNIKTFQGFK